MSTPQTAGRTPAPGDDDLQHLYDEVWRIFDEEASETERSPVAAVTTSNVRESLNNHVRIELDTFGQPMLSSRAVTASPRPPQATKAVTFTSRCGTATDTWGRGLS
ncbi:hypothetical protein EDD15DRAFT_609647 [Pisolithus albus]|nr:hypothetical protein EDD15DRAFT_609647 [Pisolithus albus]